ncbi:sodium/proton antiporter, CPA1 family [Jatrophihabitans endophyticus]|uniref:Sodium/proton antiporter, CPA1 family n=1 Tax=Jatrophihabitans endophyticus TaxID=1206085 RepID=A0A1M5G732_9ACTN|nr:potassium/proton antiporter [Jatrophihabitans endophyticus]SHF99484.1 sodium/proton antiporter, CPA1 family [Jatrophihabitans endophyticus]
MHDLLPYGRVVLYAALAVLLAVASNRLTEWTRIPAPALFLAAAAVASNLVPELGHLDIVTDQRIVTIALVVILFDGGMHIGWRRMRPALGGVLWLGVAGTLVTTAALAVAVHLVLGWQWQTALVLGAALAPTDPAVVFSVLGRREISGRSGTLLEGESGANDPVGIALMISLLGATGGGLGAVGSGVGHFALQLVVGGVVGVLGGWFLLYLMRRMPLPNPALYPVQTLAVAFALFGVATVAEGSGYLAVFVAGILVGDERAPYKREIEHFAGALAGLAEIVAFTVLGLSVDLHDVLSADRLWTGLLVAAVLILLARPLFVGLVLAPLSLTRGERGFVLFAGLKGAVPILLGTYVLVEGGERAHEIYDIVFVVVLVSVVVQGGLVPTVAKLLRVPMRTVEAEPWALGMRFRDEPEGLHRYVVAAGSRADGCTVADLDVGQNFWISMVSRQGRLVQVRGETVLRPGDEVLALADADDAPDDVFAP